MWHIPSRVGAYLGWNWLIYNPGVFLEFDLVARRNAPPFVDAVLMALPAIKTVCDLGCGSGRYVAEFRRHGVAAQGFEYGLTPRLFARARGLMIGRFDLEREPPLPRTVQFDLAMTLEVGEHIPPYLSGQFVRTLVALSDRIIFTAAQPHQEAPGHINCREKAFWRRLFEAEGFTTDLETLAKIQHGLESKKEVSAFLRSNLLVLRKQV
jgi:SAM-dependent methyltransferase